MEEEFNFINHLFNREYLARPLIPDFWKNQKELDVENRTILVNWLNEIIKEFSLNSETFFYAVNLMDRYLALTPNFTKSNYQLLGAVCIWSASKYVEIAYMSVNIFIRICAGQYSKEDFFQMEKSLLNTVKFLIQVPTELKFIILFQNQLSDSFFSNELYVIHCYLYCELAILDYRFIKDFSPSVVAVAAVINVANHYGEKVPSKMMELIYKYHTFLEISKCKNLLCDHLKKYENRL